MRPTRTVVAAVILVSVLIGGTGIAAADSDLYGVTIPESAAPGETVTVSAEASADYNYDYDITVTVVRTDTGATVCEDSTQMPGEVSCSGSFQMPDQDVRIHAYFSVGGGPAEENQYGTITVTEPANTPIDLGTGPLIGVGDENTDTPTGNTPSDGTTETDEGGGILDQLLSGITDTGKAALEGVIKGVVFNPFKELLTPLVKAVATVLVHIPDVDPNPAVEEVHGTTLLVAVGFAGLAFAVTGVLYQTGPVFGISYGQVRMLLPRLVLGLGFAVISLPMLQLTVDATNALSLAFRPPLLEQSLTAAAGTSAALVLVWIINAFLLVSVAGVYILADVYLLFVAGISPLIAIAWAMPRTQRYAQTFIGGWWTALAMGPLAMLVLRFVFTMMNNGGATFGQAVSNWLYGIAGFMLLLLIPYQLYGASQQVTRRAFRATRGVKRGVRREYRRRSGGDDTLNPRSHQFSEGIHGEPGGAPHWQPDDNETRYR